MTLVELSALAVCVGSSSASMLPALGASGSNVPVSAIEDKTRALSTRIKGNLFDLFTINLSPLSLWFVADSDT